MFVAVWGIGASGMAEVYATCLALVLAVGPCKAA